MLRTLLLLVPALVLSLLVDGLATRAGHGARWIDPYLITVVVFAARGPKLRGMGAGALAGLVQDLAASMVFGIHYLGKLAVGYAASLLAGRLIPGQALTAAVLLGGGTLLEKAVFAALGPLLGSDFSAGSVGEIVVQAGVNVVAGLAVFRLVDRFDRRRPGGSGRGR